MLRERVREGASGWIVLPLSIIVVAAALRWSLPRLSDEDPLAIVTVSAISVLVILILKGFFVVNPNEGVVLQFFGDYVGTVKKTGLRWVNPFYSKHRLSLRVRNFDSERLKVNDLDGNPIEIAAVVVWRVVDTAEASFEVEDYLNFVRVQTEAAVRSLATRYPYDAHDDITHSLRGAQDEVGDELQRHIQERLARAGVEVMEARISHLAYAQEIAQAMLQRQQAGAIVAARTRIVEGAVGMVEMALARLAEGKVIELDEERKAHMVANLLVVLCGERSTQPIINTGTLHP